MNAIEKLLRDYASSKSTSFAHTETKTNPCKKSKKVQEAIAFLGHKAIWKLGYRNVSIGNKYENAVKNRLDKVGGDKETFTATPRPWAVRINNGLIMHKESGQVYMEYYYLSNAPTTSIYVWEDGTELTEGELTFAKENLFQKKYTSVKQAAAGLDEEEQVKVNIVKIENVLRLKAYGQEAWQELK